MNLYSKIKQFFFPVQPVNKITHFVIFDGENLVTPSFTKLYRPSEHVQYVWVTGGTVPKVVTASRCTIVKPFGFGKESADKHICMNLMLECHDNPTLNRVTIVSNDSDFLDVIGYAAKFFPNIKFCLAIHGSRPYKKVDLSKLPVNASRVTYK